MKRYVWYNKMSRNKQDLLKNYRNVYGKSSAKREYRDEDFFLKVHRALSKRISLLI